MEPSKRTRRRLTDSLEDAAERDPDFAQSLQALVTELQALPAAAPGDGGVVASGGGQAVGGNVDICAEGGSAAALTMGDVTIGAAEHPRMPGREKG